MSQGLYESERKARQQPVLDREAKLIHLSGKPQFTPVPAWRNHELRYRFSAADSCEPARNTLVAFLDLKLEPSALIVHGCDRLIIQDTNRHRFLRERKPLTAHTEHRHPSSGNRWIGLPGRPQVDSATNLQRKDPTTGKFLWTPVLEILDHGARERLQRVALEAVDKLLGRGAP